MELIFEQTTNLGSGVNPAAIHMADNMIYFFAVEDGRLMVQKWDPGAGDVPWGTPGFQAPIIATRDKFLSLYRLKNIPRVGIMGAWHQDAITIGEKIVTPERQRFAIWDALNDLTNYLESGSIRMDLENIVAAASFTFKNPSQYLSGENETRMTPGNKMELFFTMGDSELYPMGVFYIDRVDMSTAGETITVDCRNISGKVLKDQKFDGLYNFPKDIYADNVEKLLINAGLLNFDVQQPDDPGTAWQIGAEFPPDMDLLTGLNELIRMSINWVVRETLDGQIIAGSTVTYDPIKTLNSTYTFNRGVDLFSRGVTRDDNEVYSKICHQSKDSATGATLRAYTNVTHALEWAYAPHKTLYITTPENTELAELQSLSDALADKMAFSGVTEQFTGPFRPHILPGDEAEIISTDGTKVLGLITTISHSFGKDGFATAFTVDSAGRQDKPQLKDMIANANKTTQNTSIKRIY